MMLLHNIYIYQVYRYKDKQHFGTPMFRFENAFHYSVVRYSINDLPHGPRKIQLLYTFVLAYYLGCTVLSFYSMDALVEQQFDIKNKPL